MSQPHGRHFAGGGVGPRIGNFAQPGADPCIGGVAIHFEAFGTELASQRHVKAAAQIADETLNLAFGLWPVWLAQPRPEPIMMREIEEGLIVAMPARGPRKWLQLNLTVV